MQTKQKVMLWSLLAALVIGINTYLVFQKNSVQRSFYVTDWGKVRTGDLIQTLNKPGKTAPAEDHHVYFDQEQGVFQQFLVQKGDEVQDGTPLYEYTVTNAKENRQTLEGKVDELEGMQEDLESHLQQLKQLKASAAADSDDDTNKEDEAPDTDEESLNPESKKPGDKPKLSPELKKSLEEKPALEPDPEKTPDENPELDPKAKADSASNASSGIEYSIQLEIAQTQLQIDRTASQIEAYQNQIQDLKDHETVKVKSQHAGTVKDLSDDLKNPVATIASDKLLVQGTLGEQDAQVVKKGMKTVITSDLFNKDVEGKVQGIDKLPEGEPSIHQDSSYPFTVQFNSKEKGIKPGYHVNLDIVTAQALDAVAIPDQVMASKGEQPYSWVLSNQGTTDKRALKTGLNVDGKYEVKSGLKQGEWMAKHPDQIKQNGATFFTPLRWKHIHPSVLQQVGRAMLSRIL